MNTKPFKLPDGIKPAYIGVWLIDTQTPKNFINELSLYVHPDDHHRMTDHLQLAIEKGIACDLIFRMIFSDSTLHYVWLQGHASQAHITGVLIDVTKFMLVEKELRHNQEIADDMTDKANKSNQAKSEFLAVMSHEIRTPLNGVMGMSELLMYTPLSLEQQKYVESIRISGDALLHVVNDILDFSKIEAGRMELENADFDLNALVYTAIEMVEVQAQKKGIEINVFVDPALSTWLIGDSSRIRQILNNFLSNAVKFTTQGEISLRVRVLKREGRNIELLFEVSDTGMGIEPEVLARLFEPYIQGDASTARKHGGTGLGLAISKRFVNMMGGKIGVESQAGQGSRFWFSVELCESKNTKPETEYELIPEMINARILYVDDNAINRELVKYQLHSLQLACDLAANGGEALTLLKCGGANHHAYSLVIVDTKMPGMSGLELIKIIRQLADIAKIPIITLCSIGEAVNDLELKRLNISMNLFKPLRKEKLYNALLYIMRDKQGKVSPASSGDILLVDDNIINQQVFASLLIKLGYTVDVVNNGIEAVKRFQEKKYDLILMDCQMSEMDGYTATQEIRKLEQKKQMPPIPIIAITAHALKGHREKCIAAGMNDYIAKPFDMKILAELLQQYLPKKLTSTTIDMNRLHEIFGDDSALIQQFIQVYITATETLLLEVAETMRAKDVVAVKKALHTLKGSSGNCGVTKIYQLAKQAEQAVLNQEWDVAEKHLKEIQDVFAILCEEFKS